MAVTISFSEDDHGRQRVGKQFQVTGRLTLTSTYETGGFAIAASDFGLNAIESVSVNSNPWETTEAYTASWDRANSKIKLGWTGGAISSELDEIANSDDVSGVVLDVTVTGR